MRQLRLIAPIAVVTLIFLSMFGIIGPRDRPRAPAATIDSNSSTIVEHPPVLAAAPMVPKRPQISNSSLRVRGRVYDAATTIAIRGARVYFGSARTPYVDSTSAVLTDDDGKFEMPISEGTADPTVFSVADGYVAGMAPVADPAVPLDVPLDAGTEIEGTVSETSGAGVAGVRVTATVPWNRTAWPRGATLRLSRDSLGAETTSDERGGFKLRGLSRGTSYDLLASKSGWSILPMEYPRVVAPASQVRIQVVPEALVTLRFVDDADGSTLLDAPQLWTFPERGLSPVSGAENKTRGVVSQRYLFSAGDARPRSLKYHTTSMLFERAEGKLDIKPSSAMEVTVRCHRREPAGSVLQLKAVFQNGTPFSGITHLSIGRVEQRNVADAIDLEFVDGILQGGPRIPPGHFELRARTGASASDGYWIPFAGSREIVVNSDGSCVPASLEVSGGRLSMTVRRSDGSVIRGLLVKCLSDTPGLDDGWRALSASDSDAATLWLCPGQNHLVAGLPQVGSVESSFIVGANGEEVPLELTLVPGDGVDLWKSRHR